MEDRKIEVKMSDKPGQQVLLIGEALTPKEPEQYTFAGDIESVNNFLKGRRKTGHPRQYVDKSTSVVEVDEEQGTIVLYTDPNDPFGSVIIGKLMEHPDLKPWGINTTKTFKREEVVKLLKFNRMAFADQNVWLKVMEAFQKFSAKTAGDHASESDTRGNRLQNFSKSVESNLPEGFSLNLPIYKGKPAETIMVEICQEVTDGGAHFWFESPELKALLDNKKDMYIRAGLTEAGAAGLVIMWK